VNERVDLSVSEDDVRHAFAATPQLTRLLNEYLGPDNATTPSGST